MHLALLAADAAAGAVLPALPLLPHTVRLLPPAASSVARLAGAAVAVVDARGELVAARALCRVLSGGSGPPVVGVLAEGGLIAVTGDWGLDDIVLPGAGPAEIDARLRLLAARHASTGDGEGGMVVVGELGIDEETYVARVRGRPLDLTYKEFELLKYLCRHPGRVFSRAQLLGEAARPDLQGVRAAQVPVPAPRPGVLARPAPPRGVGVRLLRWHPHRR